MELNKIRSVGGKIARIRFAIVMILVGIIFGALGGFFTFSNLGKDTNYVQTEAVITELADTFDDGDDLHDVIISYVVDGETKTSTFTVGTEDYVLNNTITIYYDANDPDTITDDPNGSAIISVVILVVGIGAFALGVFSLVKGIKDKGDQFEQVDMSKISQDEIDAIANSDEEEKDFLFHFDGKLNQSYVLETLSREPVVSMNCDKIGVFTKFKFVFTNHLTGNVKNYEVGHTVTDSYGGDGFSFVAKSSFKVNGVDVFKMIGDMGYSIISKIEGIRLNFDICHYGVKVASLRAAGANAAKAGSNYGKLGDIPTTGVFEVKARESDIDAVALIAFAVSRVEFF